MDGANGDDLENFKIKGDDFDKNVLYQICQTQKMQSSLPAGDEKKSKSQF